MSVLTVRQMNVSPDQNDLDDLTAEYYVVHPMGRHPHDNDVAIVKHLHGMIHCFLCDPHQGNLDTHCEHTKVVKQEYRF